MKKLFAVLMALSLVLAMGTIAFAAGTGTITIDNALEGATYNIYKMFDFEAIDGDTSKGRYTYADTKWQSFVETGDGKAYLAFDADTGTIKWVGAEVGEEGNKTPDPVAVAELAKKAIAYAKENSIAATATKTAADGVVTFENVDLGYYAIDTSLGTICALTNVDDTFEAHEKNKKPDIDKEVQEDADNSWGKVNDADINQVVNYKSTVTVGLGVTNYVMHDTMEAGLTFNNDVTVFVNGVEVDEANYTVTTPATHTVKVSETETTEVKHTFDVAFDDDYILGLAQGTEIVVTYSATLNENAKVETDGNDNTVYLSYGEDSTWETAEHKTTTYTWKMDVLKYTLDGTNPVELAGAVFQLLKTKNVEDSAISFVEVTEVNGAAVAVPTYRVAVTGDDAEDIVKEITTDENGKFEIVGLDEGTYYLHEKTAPEGYNKLADDLTVTITSEHKDAELTATYKINGETPATIEVENKTGGLLPETGGIGTTIFYVVGGLLMVAALIVLVSKKRMSSFA